MAIRSRPRKALGIFVFVILAAVGARAADNSPDTTAKFLAGLVVPAEAADAANDDNVWVAHSVALDQAWKRTGQLQLPAIASWAPEFLGPPHQQNNTMFYMFSGPDFLYAHAFFPNARTYILCGTEPVGSIPDLSKIPAEALPDVLTNIRKSLDSILNWSFFITKEMKTDLVRTQLSGTLPLLYVFLARTGCTIDSVRTVALDRTGALSENEQGETPGVQITFTSSAGLSQTVYYFCTDLSDDAVKSNPGFLKFCEAQGEGVSLLKAASYLMHEPEFSRVRSFVLRRSEMILQDDSGIPLRFLAEENWDVRYCGRYTGPIDVFKKYWQPDLANEYAHNVSVPLPFGFGYQWRPNRSDLMILTRAQSNVSRGQPRSVHPNELRSTL